MNVYVPLTLVKAAALTGISFVWASFTVQALKMGWHIATFSLEKKEEVISTPYVVVCEECQKHFVADENFIIHEKLLCEDCRPRN